MFVSVKAVCLAPLLGSDDHSLAQLIIIRMLIVDEKEKEEFSHFRNCAPPLDEKGGIITEKVFPVFSERVFWACFGLVI